MLEMDRLERQLVNLPLLQDPSSYIPDTVDLTEDAMAREYWLYCFEEALDGVGLEHRSQNSAFYVNNKQRLFSIGDDDCGRCSSAAVCRCEQVVKRAVASQPDALEATERAEKFRQKYRHKLQTLRHQPLYGLFISFFATFVLHAASSFFIRPQ